MNASPKTKSQSIDTLYILKILAAFLVVCCHFPINSTFRSIVEPMVSTAVSVPLFFIISGYFLYSSKVKEVQRRCKRAIGSTSVLIIICNLAYFLWNYPKHGSVIRSWADILDILLYGDGVIVHLWYLTAFFWSLCLYYIYTTIMTRRGKEKFRPLFILIPLCLIPVFSETYSYILGGGSFMNVYTAIPQSLPYLTIGMVLREQEHNITRYCSWWGLVALFVLLHIEYAVTAFYSDGRGGKFLLLSPFFCVLATGLCLKYKDWKGPYYLVQIGKQYTGNIYYWHMAVATVLIYLLRFAGLMDYWDDIAAPSTFIASLGLAYVIVWVQERLNIRILR